MNKDLNLLLIAAIILVESLFVFAGTAIAHKPSDSYLTLTLHGDRIEGRWDIALRDLDHALGLDEDQNGALTWGEVKRKHPDIAAYALARLELKTNTGVCRLFAQPQLVENHSDGAHTVLPFSAKCSGAFDSLVVRYGLFFDLDPLHRGLLQIRNGQSSVSAVLAPDQRSYSWSSGAETSFQNLITYGREGVWHILIGFDHILFLLCLLLPAGLRRVDGGWQRVASWNEAVWPVVHTVTAFTLAHTITLCVSAVGLFSLPSLLVESVIALSIIVAALNNIWPVVTKRLWLLAFFFGLIHGFGFSSVLIDLGLPTNALLVSLFGFNLGVELGQLAIILATLPVIYSLRLLRLYARILMPAGSAATAIVAGIWFYERATESAIF